VNYISNVAFADGGGSSYDPAELRQLSQPQVPEEWEQDVFVPDILVLEQPLINDDVRRTQLYKRLVPHSFVQQLPLRTTVDLVYQQAEVEKKIEASLILDGIHPAHFLVELNRLRGVLFYPQGTPLSSATLARYIREIAQSGTRQSIPYRRVYRAIRNCELFINYILNNR
jgi:photosystem II P680 reaction center D1 protein